MPVSPGSGVGEARANGAPSASRHVGSVVHFEDSPAHVEVEWDDALTRVTIRLLDENMHALPVLTPPIMFALRGRDESFIAVESKLPKGEASSEWYASIGEPADGVARIKLIANIGNQVVMAMIPRQR